jgi:hypothetical protein
MKILQTVTEVEKEGLNAVFGETVILYCANYFYTGKLVGINKTCVKLEDPAIVYSTGAFTDKKYADEQPMGTKAHYVRLAFIESFGPAK